MMVRTILLPRHAQPLNKVQNRTRIIKTLWRKFCGCTPVCLPRPRMGPMEVSKNRNPKVLLSRGYLLIKHLVLLANSWDKQVYRDFLLSMAPKLGIKTMEDWYKISYADLKRADGSAYHLIANENSSLTRHNRQRFHEASQLFAPISGYDSISGTPVARMEIQSSTQTLLERIAKPKEVHGLAS